MNATLWSHLFYLELPLLEKILRPVLVYLFLVIALRLAGKRELAQLNPFDLVVLLTLSNTVQNAIIGNDNSLVGGVVGATTLLAVNSLAVRFLYQHQRLDRLLEGEATLLIENGRIQTKRLDKERITLAELETAAHRQGFGSLEEVERAVLEPGGAISFLAMRASAEGVRQRQILARLDHISRAMEQMRRDEKP